LTAESSEGRRNRISTVLVEPVAAAAASSTTPDAQESADA
jgi:hypothetical protein